MEKNDSCKKEYRAQNLVIGGGIAGIVTALELLDGGQSVVLLDADTPDRFGGLALWAFGGMALCGTPEQKRMGVDDSPELCLEDWIRFGELEKHETWPLAWAACYVRDSREWGMSKASNTCSRRGGARFHGIMPRLLDRVGL